MTVNIQARFRKDSAHFDGLSASSEDIAKAPLQPRVVVAVLECTRVTHNVTDGTDTPTMKLTAVELCEGADALQVTSMLERLYNARTGRDDHQPTLFDRDHEAAPGAPAATEGQADDGERAWPGDVDFSGDAQVQAADRPEPPDGDDGQADDEAADPVTPTLQDLDQWQADDEQVDPGAGNVADEPESSPVKRSARKPRK